MFWADKIAPEIIKLGKYKPYWVDDMKTPSGRIHVGALRGVIIHDLVYKALLNQGEKATFSYVINDMDPMDAFPEYLDDSFRQYMGFPLFKISSPEKGFDNFGHFFAQEFIDVFNRLGAKPKILWSSKMYQEGKFNQVIKEALDNQAKIRELYKKVSGYDKPKDWYPFQVICPQCGRVGTTKVDDWDGQEVSFECKKDLVDWAQGCGFKSKISPFDGMGKLMWKVDWAAHWKVIGVTIEAAGKDHFSAGGSHDLSGAISKEVFHYQTPYGFLYEWFLTKGGKKMSSSKGIGMSAQQVAEILPAQILRFLLTRTSYKRAIDFDAGGNKIPDWYDEYDRCAGEWFQKGRKSDFGRIFELSQVDGVPKKSLFLPRFREVAYLVQMPNVNLLDHFEKEKDGKLTEEEIAILEERVRHAKIWLKNYAPQEMKFQVLGDSQLARTKINLSEEQKEYLGAVKQLLQQKDWQPEKLQYQLYEIAKKAKISPKNAFQAIYLALIGKTHGPKAAWLILSQEKEFIIKRLSKVTGEEND